MTSLITPHKLLGFVKPFLRKNGNEILGIYGISLDDYPELIPIWGSVRIKIENTLMFYPKVIIVHVPKEEYEVDFIAISERCPHEGYPIKDLDPDLHLFECSGHGTLFDVTGKYVWGPASRDLERLHLEYDGDKTIYLEVPLYPLNKLDEKEDVLAFLNQNKPNPCENYTTIVFGTSEPAEVNILLFDQKGNEVMLVFSGKCISHYNELLLDVSKLSIGNYFLKMIVNGKPFATRKVIIAR
ncbi:MAG: Rieske 2Fe-2S domain-containing protein [Ignavibacteria bacterium]|nr:Rieske 2Fe-2S domain-containing protein [Ignavibacteria bacterium]